MGTGNRTRPPGSSPALNRGGLLVAVLSAVAVIAAVLPATAQTPVRTPPQTPGTTVPDEVASGQVSAEDWHGIQGGGPGRIHSLDRREGSLIPTARQRTTVDRLGATRVTWNDFGTPHTLIKHGGYLTGAREGPATEVARAFVEEHRGLFRLSPAQVDRLAVLNDSPLYEAPDLKRVYRQGKPPANPDVAHVVLFRQTFDHADAGDLHAGWDGLLTVGVQHDGRIAWVSSSTTADSEVEGARRLDAAAAIRAAAADVDFEVGALTRTDPDGDWTAFASDTVDDPQHARLVAFPTYNNGVRLAYEVVLLKGSHDEAGHPLGFQSYVDADTGTVWKRENIVDHFDGERQILAQSDEEEEQDGSGAVPQPRWRVFPANPPFVNSEEPSEDTRVLWCWQVTDDNREECAEEQENDASRVPWDVNPPNAPSGTTDGNNASTAISQGNFTGPDTVFDRPPPNPERDYDYAWANTWFNEKCSQTTFATDNDDDASVTNLFVMHNRMHDFSYFLGFTERNSNLQKNNFGNTDPDRGNDPEIGQAQAGRGTVLGRDNANQATPPDGQAPRTNQYLWQPLGGVFYAPCVDGAYDMAIVAHEYTHAITNRMIAGPDTGTGDSQGQTESWSDLGFAAYYRQFGIEASEEANQFALAPYVTFNQQVGVRNYGMNDSPLNYSDLSYDGNGLGSPHANGEIWSAVNYDISVALAEKYDDGFRVDDAALQQVCARGELAAEACPGNRRWAQIMFDGFLLNPPDSTMIESRDAMLAADMLRFDGANQDELWNVFASRGLGESASSEDVEDTDPIPGWDSPRTDDEATVRFVPVDAGGGVPETMEVFTGVYEARITPTAVVGDSEQFPDVDDTEQFVPGTYQFIARADGFGAFRFRLVLEPGADAVVKIPMRRNHASVHNGGKADGDGVNLDKLIDDSEELNWGSFGPCPPADQAQGSCPGAPDDSGESPDEEGRQVEDRQVTVELAGGAQEITDIQVSAALRGALEADESGDTPPDAGSQSRFSALRSFDILACDATSGGDCADDEDFEEIFASADDAFDGGRPRPLAPNFTLRGFNVADTRATHLRLRVRDNQCTGTPEFQGDVNPSNDPAFALTDCDSGGSDAGREIFDPPEDIVRAAELQAFSAPVPTVRVDGDGVHAAAEVDTEAICPPGQVPGSGFGDIGGSLHEANIACVKWYTITEGVTGDSYAPGERVSRAQMASFIARLATEGGIELPTGATDAFGDDDGNVHEANINALAELGLVNGVGGGDYAPGAEVSRSQMATFIANVHDAIAGQLPTEPGDAFDDDTGNTHEASINALAALGVVQGRVDTDDVDGDGNTAERVYAPAADVSRGQMASFIITDLALLVRSGDAFAGGADVSLDDRAVPAGGDLTGTVATHKQLEALTADGCGLESETVTVDGEAFSVAIGDDQAGPNCTLELYTDVSRGDAGTQRATESFQVTVAAEES